MERHEIEALAAFLGMDVDAFVDHYTRLAPSRKNLALTEQSDGACIFLTEDNRCLIQDVKPRQCRDFPNEWDIPKLRKQCNARDTWQENE